MRHGAKSPCQAFLTSCQCPHCLGLRNKGSPLGRGRTAAPFREVAQEGYSDEPDARVTNNLMASRVARMAVPKATPRSSRLGVKAPSPVPSA